MLRINAAAFVKLMDAIVRMEVILRNLADEHPGGLHKSASEYLWELLLPHLDEMESQSRFMELEYVVLAIGRLRERFAKDAFEFPALATSLKNLGDLIHDQLNDRILMFIETQKVKYFQNESAPFGLLSQDKFPEAAGDISDASRCLGVGCPTAAVYHLMRVMEVGIRRLAKRLKLPKHLEHKTWGEILGSARAAIAAMLYTTIPEKNKRDIYSETVAHLNNVKDAWRNPTMHARRRYTEEEAEAIYANVRTFMNHLAEKVLK